MTNRDTYDIEVYKEEVRQMKNGINIQVNTLIDAMVDAEKCLFHNSDANLMVNSLLSEEASPAVKETTSPFVFRGAHPNSSARDKMLSYWRENSISPIGRTL